LKFSTAGNVCIEPGISAPGTATTVTQATNILASVPPVSSQVNVRNTGISQMIQVIAIEGYGHDEACLNQRVHKSS
jgi:hypothetical protein